MFYIIINRIIIYYFPFLFISFIFFVALILLLTYLYYLYYLYETMIYINKYIYHFCIIFIKKNNTNKNYLLVLSFVASVLHTFFSVKFSDV